VTRPRPTPAHDALQMMVGVWEGEETIHPSPFEPDGGTATARVSNVRTLDGFVIVQDCMQRRAGQANFSGHGVLWHDGGAHQYVMTWWDSWGMPPTEFRGTVDGTVLTLRNRSPQGHARGVWDYTAGTRYTYRMEVSPDGTSWYPFLEGSYRKVG
jgi:hypothetical protein